MHSPKIERVEVMGRGEVRRAKLYYLRGRVGRRARVRESRDFRPEDVMASSRRSWSGAPGCDAEEPADGGEAPRSVRRRGGCRRGRRGSGGSCRRGSGSAEEACGGGGRGRGTRPKRRRPGERRAEELPMPTRRRQGRRAPGGTSRRGQAPRRATEAWRRSAPSGPARTPREQRRSPLADRAAPDRRGGARSGAADPGLPREAVPDSERIHGTDPGRRPTRAGEPLQLQVERSRPRRHRRLPSAEGGREQCLRRRAPREPGLPSPTRRRDDVNFIKRIVAVPGDTLSSGTAMRS